MVIESVSGNKISGWGYGKDWGWGWEVWGRVGFRVGVGVLAGFTLKLRVETVGHVKRRGKTMCT